MQVWTPEDTEKDTVPPPPSLAETEQLRAMLRVACGWAKSVADGLELLDGALEGVSRDVARDRATDHMVGQLEGMRAGLASLFAGLHAAVVAVGTEMAACDQSPELYELDLEPDRIARDLWRARAQLLDRPEWNRSYTRYERPLRTTTDDYVALHKKLATYLAELERPAEAS